ncbi:MAG TPA: SDR family oxidoreductase [Kineosporiaceae bacterium]|nr:SDR family oxidoreductase [Kineosporiaceae bacterium]
MTIIVTGGSGQYARLAVRHLLHRVPAGELVVTTRRPEVLDDLAERGVQVRRADFSEPESLPSAFAGGTKMLLISTTQVGQRVAQHTQAIRAAVDAGVQHIAYTSFIGAGAGGDSADRAMVVVDHAGTEEVLRASGAAYTFLRDGQYAEAVSDVIAPRVLAEGLWAAAAGDGQVAFVSREDCAACGAQVLLSSGHENKAYDITGPQLLSFRDAAALVSEIGGRPVDYAVISDEQLYAAFDAMGVPRRPVEDPNVPIPWCSDDMVSFERAIREGQLAVLSDDVRTILGRAPRSLAEVLRDRFTEPATTASGA